MVHPVPNPALVARFRTDLTTLAGSPDSIGVALSGGPDSVALLLLAAAAWPGLVAAATVDHGLRAESQAEAALAASICSQIGVPHRILPTVVPRRASVQAAARESRYAALRAWAEERGIAAVVTAHHADDQAETVMMRLARGSGVAGLAGIRARSNLSAGIMLIRPLLGWRRCELAAIVTSAGFAVVDDPSNRDDAFDRVRMRRRLAAAEWIDPLALGRSAAALAEVDALLDELTASRAAERLSTGDGWAQLFPDGVAPVILRRLVIRALAHVSPDASPRGQQLSALLDRLAAGQTCTLGGALCRGGHTWRFEPEPPRR